VQITRILGKLLEVGGEQWMFINGIEFAIRVLSFHQSNTIIKTHRLSLVFIPAKPLVR
jgi:hypothetical protein